MPLDVYKNGKLIGGRAPKKAAKKKAARKKIPIPLEVGTVFKKNQGLKKGGRVKK